MRFQAHTKRIYAPSDPSFCLASFVAGNGLNAFPNLPSPPKISVPMAEKDTSHDGVDSLGAP